MKFSSIICLSIKLCMTLIRVALSCNPNNVQIKYETATEISENPDLTHYLIQVLNRCELGKLHLGLDFTLCMDHCSLRPNCTAFYMLEDGCQFCIANEETVGVYSWSLDTTYVNMDYIHGKLSVFLTPL